MAWLSILDRFRPVGSPGPVGPAGVPAADDPGASAELGAVFAALGPDVEFCREIVAAAQQSAEAQLTQAREQAAARVADARLSAAEVRARAAVDVVELAADRDAHIARKADDEADEIRQRGAERIPALVRTIVGDLVDEQLRREP